RGLRKQVVPGRHGGDAGLAQPGREGLARLTKADEAQTRGVVAHGFLDGLVRAVITKSAPVEQETTPDRQGANFRRCRADTGSGAMSCRIAGGIIDRWALLR